MEEQQPSEFKSDPARYREASIPHESEAAANEAIANFDKAVGELRVKYQIKDVLVIYGVAILGDNGGEYAAMGSMALGNQTLWESMAAYAYGREKAAREQRIGKLLGA